MMPIDPHEARLRELERHCRTAAEIRSCGAQRIDLAQEPRLSVVPAPALSPAHERELEAARTLLEDSEWRFDGAIWLVNAIGPEGVEVFPASYAWLFCPAIDMHLGPLCICIDITERGGQRLIQWANPDLVNHPDPRLAVGGYVDADEHPREAALREADEELGLSTRCLADLTARRLLATAAGVMVIYGATIDPEHPLRLGNEVQEVAWIATGAEEQLLPDEQLAYLA